jgi:hypothetical protein
MVSKLSSVKRKRDDEARNTVFAVTWAVKVSGPAADIRGETGWSEYAYASQKSVLKAASETFVELCKAIRSQAQCAGYSDEESDDESDEDEDEGEGEGEGEQGKGELGEETKLSAYKSGNKFEREFEWNWRSDSQYDMSSVVTVWIKPMQLLP